MPNGELIHLSHESIKDYQTCALLYRYRHMDNMYESIGSREVMSTKYENTLKKLAAFFFYKKQGGIVPSMSAILNRWEKLWFPKDASAYDIATEKHESLWGNLSSLNTKAVNCISGFYDDFYDDNKDPILVNESFMVPIYSDVVLNGVFDAVLRNPIDKSIHVIKWLASPKRPNLSSLSMDFSILRYAFEHKNPDKAKSTKYYAYDLGSEKNALIEVDVQDADISTMKYWAKQVSQSSVFMPRRGLTSYCKKCPFDSPCADFCVTSEMIEEK